MKIDIGDLVTRKSYNNDTIFKVININNSIAFLKGEYDRLFADAQISDLKKVNDVKDEFIPNVEINSDRNQYFYLPGKILHIDGDNEYLDKCLKYYKELNLFAVGKRVDENEIATQIVGLLKEIKPDIVIITGHDAFYSKNGDINNIDNYKNSKNFIKAIKAARKYESSHDKLIIIAGACQSNYEELIKAGANFASSPKRVNIHALDPAIIASYIALTKRNDQIDLVKLLNKTKYGSKGMGGIITNGLMYVGFPR